MDRTSSAVLRGHEVPDLTGDAPGAFLGYGRTGGADQLAMNIAVIPARSSLVPPGSDPSQGHSHMTIEEIYLVLDGEVQIKLADEVVSLEPRDAVVIAPETPRLVRNFSGEEAVVLMTSKRVEDQAAESRFHPNFWTD